MFGKNKKEKKSYRDKSINEMDDFDLVGAQHETLNEYYKVNEKLSGLMLVGSIASKAILFGSVFALFSLFGAFSGAVKNVVDIFVPISLLGGLAGRTYFNSKEEEVDQLIEEADGLEQQYENYKDEFDKRMENYENERLGKEIFPELRGEEDENDEPEVTFLSEEFEEALKNGLI